MANLTGTAGDDTIVGANAINDIIGGAAGNDLLFGYGDAKGGIGLPVPPIDDSGGGGTDHDRLAGGLGDDTIRAGGGNDTAEGGDGQDQLFGGDGNDSLAGNAGNDSMRGGWGADRLDGGTGADTMLGGDGDDVYIVDDIGDLAIEVSNDALAGTDLVLSSVSHSLDPAVENLTLVGTAASSGVGNALANLILGNAAANMLFGGAGNDTLDGGAGADTMEGGLGDDVLVVDNMSDSVVELAGEGSDTIRWKLSTALNLAGFAEVENATVLGSAAVAITGTAGDNKLAGNSGANKIDGAGGADTMTGGGGNDIYMTDGLDTVIELAGGGTDAMISSVDVLSLAENVENLTLAGMAIFGSGNALKNAMTGNDLDNVLDGGGDGGDTMIGGKGNDSYDVDAGDVVVEALAGPAGGQDSIRWWGGGAYTLGANVEHLTLVAAAVGIGNGLANNITGNGGANTLDGKAGADHLTGGGGNDIYIFDNAGDKATEAAFGGIDEVRSSAALATAFAEVENYAFTGAGPVNFVGNLLANRISGTAGNDTIAGDDSTGGGNDTLIGGGGADKLAGGDGDDVYEIDNAKDVVDELGSLGIDTVRSKVSFSLVDNGTTLRGDVENLELLGMGAINGTGNGLDNLITGNGGANKLSGLNGGDTLDGGAGNDTLDGGSGDGAVDILRGGAGNDLYFIGAGDNAIEDLAGPAGGIDTVLSADDIFLGANIENVTLVGNAVNVIGNALANVIIGNDLANNLNGSKGNDRMSGGKGDDVYFVEDAGDIVTERAGEGDDTVLCFVDYILPAEVENLMLSSDSKIGIGNALANSLTGGVNNDTLDGRAGADKMDGADGDDVLFVDNVGDITTDTGTGIDEVRSSASHAIGTGVEILTLTGSAAINGTGNDLDNRLTGNSGANSLAGGGGNDTLAGGGGNDTLAGGGGNDEFVFAGPTPGKDSIVDFSFTDTGSGIDRLDISDLLVGYVPGVAAVSDFVQIAVGAESTTIKVDADGLAGGAKFVDVAVIAGLPPGGVTIDDIVANNLVLT